MNARAVLSLLTVVACACPLAARAESHICWIAQVVKGTGGAAAISFTESAHGVGSILSPNAKGPDVRFTVEGEKVRLREIVDSAIVEKESPVLLVPPGKEATMAAGRETCAFSWTEKDGHPGLFITATSPYVPGGTPPSSADEFVVLE